ncbi:hypothetical protein IEQ34_019992 [Dendrobium chrysotoxum]|uniref:Uncharacterized protein n=1 Tax=Dendrobium chrysotoxum TaxID=161865 RepID=A0AAV7GA05_DENCH|nr:hypothetical protein IEQ34_019992 [Dendrobium chrysotoxum]
MGRVDGECGRVGVLRGVAGVSGCCAEWRVYTAERLGVEVCLTLRRLPSPASSPSSARHPVAVARLPTASVRPVTQSLHGSIHSAPLEFSRCGRHQLLGRGCDTGCRNPHDLTTQVGFPDVLGLITYPVICHRTRPFLNQNRGDPSQEEKKEKKKKKSVGGNSSSSTTAGTSPEFRRITTGAPPGVQGTPELCPTPEQHRNSARRQNSTRRPSDARLLSK